MRFELTIDGQLSTPRLGVFRAEIQEAINQVTLIELLAVSEEDFSEGDMEELIGKPVTLQLSGPVSGELKATRFDGIIFEFHQPDHYQVERDKYIYTIVIRPTVWRLSVGCNSRSFPGKSRSDVIEEVLQEYGLRKDNHFYTAYFKQADFVKRDQIVQCEKSDWDFLLGLFEEAGINYLFRAQKEADEPEMLCLTDTSAAWVKGYDEPITWDPAANLTHERHVHRFETRVRTVPSAVESTAVMGDGKVRRQTAKVRLDKGQGGAFRHFSVEGHEEKVAKRSAERYSHMFESERVVYEGESNFFLLRPGLRFTIENPWKTDTQKKILVTAVHHTIEQSKGAALDGESDFKYTNTFKAARELAEIKPVRNITAIDARADVKSALDEHFPAEPEEKAATEVSLKAEIKNQVRAEMERLESKHNMFGVMLADVIEDAKISGGGETTCKIANERFPDGIVAKVSVAWLVPGGGMSSLPRAGMQVYFMFVQGAYGGNEAVVIGYRPSSKVPGMDPAKTTKTKRLEPGGTPDEPVKIKTIEPNNRQRVGLCGEGGAAEVTLLDGDGSVFIHGTADVIVVADAEMDLNSATYLNMSDSVSELFGSVTRVVSGDQTESIGGNHDMKVTGNQTMAVDGNQEESVKGQRKLSVTGIAERSVKGAENIKVTGVRKVSMNGGHVESVKGTQKISIKGGRTVSVSKDLSEEVKGSKTLKVKGDVKNQIDGAEKSKVKGNVSFAIDKELIFKVKDKVRIECGKSKIIIDKNGNVTVKGKKFNHKASGNVTIKGSKVNLN